MNFLVLSLAFLGYLVTLCRAQAAQTAGPGESTVRWAAADQNLAVADLAGGMGSTPPPQQPPGVVGGTTPTPPAAGSAPLGSFNLFGGSGTGGAGGGLGSLAGLLGNIFAGTTTAAPPSGPASTTPTPASSGAGGSALNDLFGTSSAGLDIMVNNIITGTGTAGSSPTSAPNGTDQLLPGLSTNDFTSLLMNSPGSATGTGSPTSSSGPGAGAVPGSVPPSSVVPGLGSIIDNTVVGSGSLPSMGPGFINNMLNMIPKPSPTSAFGTAGSPSSMAGLPPVPPKRSNAIQDNPAMMFFLMSSLNGGEMPEGAELMLPLALMSSQRKPQPPPQSNMNSLLSMMRNPSSALPAGGPMSGPLASMASMSGAMGSPLSAFSNPMSGLVSGSSSNASPSLMDGLFPASGPGTSSSGSASPASGLADLLGSLGSASGGPAAGPAPTSANTASILDSLLAGGGAGASGSLLGR